mmetsp:Transcript_3348/g.3799  ORF Transcript_3348/g.3799 Transcript_3348/m.3799 type:complete len:103 (-) Transcript_3348:473-781(-)
MGNQKGNDQQNKKIYDPWVWMRKTKESIVKRVMVSMDKLSTTGRYDINIIAHTKGNKGVPVYGHIGWEISGPGPIVVVAAGAVLGSAATLLISALFFRKSQQ